MPSFAPRVLQGLRQSHWRLSGRPGWTCAGCQGKPVIITRRWNSSTASNGESKEKPFYITTPIFYVNAEPHIGHLHTMVLADVLKRWEQVKGKQVFLCTGTDEHGMKIQRAAAKKEMDPKEFCDANSAKFRELAEAADISNDFFIRTTDQEHKDAVAQFWVQLKHAVPERLGLYKGVHEGWYCVSDECFYPEDMVRASIVPQTGKKIMVSAETENEVEWVREETWFFPLTKYKDALLKLYDENPDWIRPAHLMSEARSWVENHMEDLSITRPASRLSWGIPDPEDASQTIYVWVDALINYITKAGYGKQWTSAKDDTGIWPADLHVIGKDILRFHTIYWPALLMSLGLPVAKGVLCHNHWTMSNRKMSKSLGNVVNPFFAIQRWGVDPLRYFLMRNASLTKDMSYSNELIEPVYTKELQANIGNLFYRVARPKLTSRWSPREAVECFRRGEFEGYKAQGIFKGYDGAEDETRFFSLEDSLARAPLAFAEEMDAYNTGAAIREIFSLLIDTNRYFSICKPWEIAKLERTEQTRLLLNFIVFNSTEALRISGILLQPIMPTKASQLLDGLGVRADRRTLDFARKGADAQYGVGTEAVARTSQYEALFPPIPGHEEGDGELREALSLGFKYKTKNKMNQMAKFLAMESSMGEEKARQVVMEKMERTKGVKGDGWS